MSGVDYSKWDKMANEMSDSDEENGNHPEVTTFDEPQSVTFGGPPDSHASEGRDDPGNADVAAPIDGSAGAAAAAVAAGSTATAAPGPKVQAPINNEQLAENGAAVWGDAGGGGRVLQYVWRQARAEVTVVVPVPPGTRARDVEVSLSAKPETIAEGVADLIRVSVKAAGADGGDGSSAGAAGQMSGAGLLSPLLEGELAFQAKLDAQEAEGQVDWELKDYPGTTVARDTAAAGGEEGSTGSGDRRGVEVVLRKHCPVPNATVWWKSLLKGEPEIDVSTIKGRATNNHQSVWEEALGMFKEKVAARKSQGKISVDMGEEG